MLWHFAEGIFKEWNRILVYPNPYHRLRPRRQPTARLRIGQVFGQCFDDKFFQVLEFARAAMPDGGFVAISETLIHWRHNAIERRGIFPPFVRRFRFRGLAVLLHGGHLTTLRLPPSRRGPPPGKGEKETQRRTLCGGPGAEKETKSRIRQM